MPFPHYERCIYERKPLVEVACQLRFPTLLRIDAELPVSFQETIRDRYPVFEEAEVVELVIHASSSEAGAQQKRSKIFEFLSEDRSWKVSLNSESVSLATTAYDRWETFRERCNVIFSAFVDIYSPNYFNRVGLRYRDVILPSSLGLQEDWGRLLNPAIAGPFASPDIEPASIDGGKGVFKFRIGEDGFIQAQYGPVTNPETKERGFLIDADAFSDGKIDGKVEDAISKLDFFNRKAGSFFRWCITKELHDAMGPSVIPVL